MNGHSVEVKVAEKDKKQVESLWGMYLETDKGTIYDSVAVAKFLAHGNAKLLGATPEDMARVDQWIYWFTTGANRDQADAVGAMLGMKEVTQENYTKSMNAVKANAKTLNG